MMDLGKNSRSRRQFYNFPYAAPSSTVASTPHCLISIVLPVYNHAQFVTNAVESVLNQQKCNLELIIVNDGSTDETANLLEYFAEDPRVSIINHKNNLGLSASLNRGFRQARGNFLSWTSADNCYLPGALQLMSNFLLANPSLGLTYANIKLIDEAGEPLRQANYRPHDELVSGSADRSLPLSGATLAEFPDNFINACFLYRRELHQLLGGYRNNCRGFEDYDFWLRAQMYTLIAHLDTEAPLYLYRLHANSLTGELHPDGLAAATEELQLLAKKTKEYMSDKFEITLTSSYPEKSASAELIAAALYQHSSGPISTTREADNSEHKHCLSHGLYHVELREVSHHRELNPHSQALDAAPRFPQSADVFSLSSAGATDKSPNSLHYLHSSHLALHRNFTLGPLILTKKVPATNDNFQEIPSAVILPPILGADVLRRARDSCFSSITPKTGSLANVLVFMPEYHWLPEYGFNDPPALKTVSEKPPALQLRFCWSMNMLEALVRSMPEFTFLLVCENILERQSADYINRATEDNSNLRIVDIAQSLKKNQTDRNKQLVSLMFTLSSADLILSLKSSKLNEIDSMLELRAEAALAALAGRSVVTIVQTTKTGRFSADSSPFSAQSLAAQIFPIPHLSLLELPDTEVKTVKFFLPNLRKAFNLAVAAPNLNTLDQWLLEVSLTRNTRQILNVVLANYGQAS